MSKVNVLLSTYNGNAYLNEQLESILNQTHQKFLVHIRDDGSIDSTCQLLEQFCAADNRFKFYQGANLGVVASFFQLLKEADNTCQYFAFCDQDDYWLPQKLERAVTLLNSRDNSKPLLYCSRVEYVDSNLVHLGYSSIPKKIGFGNSLVENVVTGCTMVINQKARELILAGSTENVVMHDWWLYQILSAIGEIVYDAKPFIKYRQHSQNQVGAVVSTFDQMRRRLKRFSSSQKDAYRIWNQALHLQECFGQKMNNEDLKVLEEFIDSKTSALNRLGYLFRMKVWRQTPLDNIFLRILIALDVY